MDPLQEKEEQHAPSADHSEKDSKDHHEQLHIFVNRRKFAEGDGVRHVMTGQQIAALVDVPAANAIIRLETGPEPRQIGIEESLQIKNGMHFLVTRHVVEGGYEP